MLACTCLILFSKRIPSFYFTLFLLLANNTHLMIFKVSFSCSSGLPSRDIDECKRLWRWSVQSTMTFLRATLLPKSLSSPLSSSLMSRLSSNFLIRAIVMSTFRWDVRSSWVWKKWHCCKSWFRDKESSSNRMSVLSPLLSSFLSLFEH